MGSVLLDTDVVSELVRPSPSRVVRKWLDIRRNVDFYFSTVGEAELRAGVAILPAGRRREDLSRAVESGLRSGLGDRILVFDRAAAREYADIVATRRRTGRTVPMADCQIAAIARSRGMSVATRNVRHFEGIGLTVINPWTA